MVNLIEAIGFLPKVIDILLKLALLSVAIFFGRIAVSGWRGKLDFITKIISTVLIGFICFVVGILFPFDFVPQVKFVSEMLNSLIVAIIIYIILTLLSIKNKPDIITKKDIVEVEKEIDFLKSEVAKINNALIQKGIEPKPATEKEVRKAIKDALLKAGIKSYTIKSMNFADNFWNVDVDVGGKNYVAVVDSAGVVKEFKKQGFDFSDIFDRLKKDKFFLAGAVMALVFLIFTFSLLTPQNLERVSETFSFYGFKTNEAHCLTTSNLLEMWNNNQGRVNKYNYNIQKIDSAIDSYLGENLYPSPFLFDKQVIVNSNGTYGAFLVTNESVDTMTKSLTVLQASILSNQGYICSVNLENGNVCDCSKLSEPKVAVQITSLLKNYSK